MSKYYFILIIVLFSFNLNAKNKNKFLHNFMQNTVHRVSIMNAGIGMPPHFVDGRIHAGFEIDVLKSLQNKKINNHWNWTMGVGYFSQQALQKDYFLKLGIGLSFKMYKHIFLRPSVNNSFMNVKQLNDEFVYVGNGQYEQVKRNRFQLMPSLGLETYFPIVKIKKIKIGGFLKYEFGMQLPFSNLSTVLPINQIHIGISIK